MAASLLPSPTLTDTCNPYPPSVCTKIGQQYFFRTRSGARASCRVPLFLEGGLDEFFACVPVLFYDVNHPYFTEQMTESTVIYSDAAHQNREGVCIYSANVGNLGIVQLEAKKEPENLVHHPYTLVPQNRKYSLRGLTEAKEVLMHQEDDAVRIQRQSNNRKLDRPQRLKDWVLIHASEDTANLLSPEDNGALVTRCDPNPKRHPYFDILGFYSGKMLLPDDQCGVLVAPFWPAFQDCVHSVNRCSRNLKLFVPHMQEGLFPRPSFHTELDNLNDSFLSLQLDSGFATGAEYLGH